MLHIGCVHSGKTETFKLLNVMYNLEHRLCVVFSLLTMFGKLNLKLRYLNKLGKLR